MSIREDVRREQMLATIEGVLDNAARQYVTEPPELVRMLAPAVTAHLIDAIERADAHVEELRGTLAWNREQHDRDVRSRSEAHTAELLRVTARVRLIQEAYAALEAEGTPSEKAALTRLRNRIDAIVRERTTSP